MVKIIFTAVIVIFGLACVRANDDLFEVLDSVFTPIMPLGVPDTPLVEDPVKLKKLCELLTKDFMDKHKDKAGSLVKGLVAKVVKTALDQMSTDNIAICQLIKRNELDKANAMAKEFNKHGVESNKVRLSLLRALHELTQKGNKASLSTLLCYINQVSDKFLGVFPDKDGAKELVRTTINVSFKDPFVSVFAKEGIKAADSCPMAESTTNPSKYNSILVALYNAVIILQDK